MRTITVAPYDDHWPQWFQEEALVVGEALGDTVVTIHHIGSTSVAGLDAKPLLDMLPVVDSLEEVDLRVGAMEGLGYQSRGEYGIRGRRFFTRFDGPGNPTVNVHIFQRDHREAIDRHLAFRDFLRAHHAWALSYADLKRWVAERNPHDIEGYMDGKAGFIQSLEPRALDWYHHQHD